MPLNTPKQSTFGASGAFSRNCWDARPFFQVTITWTKSSASSVWWALPSTRTSVTSRMKRPLNSLRDFPKDRSKIGNCCFRRQIRRLANCSSRCSPSTPIKERRWRSVFPTPTSSPFTIPNRKSRPRKLSTGPSTRQVHSTSRRGRCLYRTAVEIRMS